jgi:hypothetical protein
LGWSKRETCLKLFDLILQYLSALRAFNHRDVNGQRVAVVIANGICSLMRKLINEERWHNSAISFKKLFDAHSKFDVAVSSLRNKAKNDPSLIVSETFQQAVKIYEEGLLHFKE